MNDMHTLQQQVQAALTNDDEFRDYGVEVLDSNGIITLRGAVPSREARDRLEASVRALPGVTSVINEMDVV